MPPKSSKKRKAQDDDDNSGGGDSPPPASAKPKKMTKAEKQAARERARLAVMGDSGKKKASSSSSANPTPTKRRKLSHNNAAAASSSSSPTASARQQKKEQGKALAAQWNEEQQKAKSAAPATTSSTSSRRKSTGSTPTRKSTAAAKSSTTTTTASAARSSRHSIGTSNRNSNSNSNTIPTPPSRFNTTTATTSASKSPSQTKKQANNKKKDTMYAPPPRSSSGFATSPGCPTNETDKNDLIHDNDDDDEYSAPEECDITMMKGKEAIGMMNYIVQQSLKHPIASCAKLTMALLLGIATFGLAFGHWKYNSTTGKLLLIGSTRVPYHSKYYTVDDDDKMPTPPAICYFDSPKEILDVVPPTELESLQLPEGCTQENIQPCPTGAICFQGHMLGCQAPLWQVMMMDSDNNEAKCILTQAVNETYQTVVTLLEQWSIQHLCLNHVGGAPSPLSFYATVATADTDVAGSEQPPQEEAHVVLSSTSSGHLSTSESVPLYGLYDALQVLGDQGEYYNPNLVQVANSVHELLVLETSPDKPEALLVGLTPEQFTFVEQNRLSLPCKVSRRMFGCLDSIGNICLALLKYTFKFLWYAFRYHPYFSLCVTVMISIALFYRRRKLRKVWQRRQVNKIRQLALDRLQHPGEPGAGLKPGEFSVMHLRDALSWELYPEDDYGRKTFLFEIWPRVARQIQQDNRVRKQHRPLAGVGREIWMWVATKEKSKQQHE